MTISWLSSMLPRRRAQAPPLSPAPRPAFEIELKPERSARSGGPDAWLALALERAVAAADWTRAEAIVRSADRLVRCSPRLAAALARWRLSRGEADEALIAIDEAMVATDDLRGLRIIALLLARRAAEARTELRAWRRRPSAPDAALTLSLLVEDDARQVNRLTARLQKRRGCALDETGLAALAARSLEGRDAAGAAIWAERLRAALCAHQRGASPPITASSPATITKLSRSILAREEIVPALVLAQRLRTEPPAARLLCAALELALPRFARPTIAYEALTRLSLALGDRDAAGAWIARGCRACPLSATLAALHRDVAAARSTESPGRRAGVASKAASDDERGSRRAA
jgi:hypothetical protein